MTTSIGSGQTDVSGITNNANAIAVYYTKFVSPPLNQAGVAANTWTYNFSTMEEAIGCNFPVDGGPAAVRVNCYVWRPSNSTKVGTILDGNTASNVTEPSSNVQVVHHTTFTGAAVPSAAANDVIIFEVWFQVDMSASGSTTTHHFYYDGTTANTTANATVSNHASFLETPENLEFVGGGLSTVAQTSIQKYAIAKDIVQTSKQKYHILAFTPITASIQKYNLLKLVTATTSIQKYALRKNILQTTIQKYQLGGVVLQTSKQKYNIAKYLSQTTRQKYDIRKTVAATTSIQKYALRAYLLRTIIHKYNLGGVVLQSTKHKYDIISSAVPITMTEVTSKTYQANIIRT